MHNFQQIDWNPPLEDLIDTKCVDAERFKRESVLHRVLKGKFSNPFVDIHEEQDHLVTPEILAQVELESKEQTLTAESKKISVAKTEPKHEITNTRTDYIPGLSKSFSWFPRVSNLSSDQQALCLKVLLKFYGSERPEITAADKEDLKTYMSLGPTVSHEQQEFLEFAKSIWDPSKFKIHEEEFISEQWKKKVKRVDSLPRYYVETSSVPFVSTKEIGLAYHSSCLQMGILANTILPKVGRRLVLPSGTTKINQRFFTVETNAAIQKPVIFKTPVSQDANCDVLAKEHEVDLVISSGGLNCLALNIDPKNMTPWMLPVVVKLVNGKNVVYIDKPLPPTALTVIQKNAWFYKYKSKSYFTQAFHNKAVSLDQEAADEIARYRHLRNAEGFNGKTSSNDPEDANDETNGEDQGEFSGQENREKSEDESKTFLRPPVGHNLFYRLFSIGSCGEHQSELLKNRAEKSYKLLVRSKGDGVLSTSKQGPRLVMIAAKLEHQLELGAEAVTVEEAAKQWMALTFRPEATLARIRVEATTSEVIQTETRTAMSVNNEIKRLYKLKTETALTLLYNIAEALTSTMPGRYLIRHTVRSGAFANIYKEVDAPGKNVFDIQTVYWEDDCRTIPNLPWPAIDTGVVTPVMKFHKRMPAMFRPGRSQNVANKKTQKKRTKKQKSNPGGVRKSMRKTGPQ